MSKYHKIRWKQSDLDELKRVVRNYNAKVKRLEKKDPQIEKVLPQYYDSKSDSYSSRITVGQLKELINTRRDLKREINSLKRFSKRGAEEIITVPNTDNNLQITKWQMGEIKRRVANINRRRKMRLDEISNIEVESRGEKLGYSRADIGMGRATEVSLSPMKAFTPKMTEYDVKYKWRSVMKQSQTDYFSARDYLLRENFIQALNQNFAPDDVKDIVDGINSMDIGDFLNQFNKDPETFEWAYPPSQEEYEGYISYLKSTWIPER